MGHSRVGVLPDTAPWRRVIALIADGADVAQIANATSKAAQRGLDLADSDEGLKQTFYLLSKVVLAARSEDFRTALHDIGISVPSDPSVYSIVAGFTEAIDSHLHATKSRTDVGEMAQMAAVETLTAVLTEQSRSLFETTPEDVQWAAYSVSTKTGFSALSHEFFARFTQRFLNYHLSRELGNHVGPGCRFESPSEHTEFVNQLATHSREAATIVRDFAGGWYSKTNFEGGISPAKARGFIHVALDKIRRELKIRGERDVK